MLKNQDSDFPHSLENGTKLSEIKPPLSTLEIRIWVKLSLLALEGHKDFDPIVCGPCTCEKFRGEPLPLQTQYIP